MQPPPHTDTPHPSGPPGVFTGEDLWQPGRVLFGRYEIIRQIGRGGMGVVLQARDAELGIDIALKLIPDLLVQDHEALDDLRQEVLKGMTLTHPGIVRTHDMARDGSMAAIVMEYVDGGTFHDLKRMQPGACFDAADLRPWLEQLCPALDYAHFEIQIAHRDLKPRNLMYTRAGRIKVADFGISSTLGDSMTRATLERPSSGTPAYMSPQQVMGGRPSHLDDIYSLGATLYELLTGKPPFHKGDIVYQVLESRPAPMGARCEELGVVGKAPIPDSWERAIAACLSKDPAARPRSAGDLLEWLGRPGTGGSSSVESSAALVEPAPTQPVEAPAPRRRRRTHPVVWTIATAAMLGGALYLAGNRKDPARPPAPPAAPAARLVIQGGETLPAGTAGTAYAHGLAATGGTVPYRWALAAGELPSGLRLDEDGRIHGVPDAAGTANLEIQVKDARQQSARRSCQLAIQPQPVVAQDAKQPSPSPRITAPKVLPQGVAGTHYHFELSAAGGEPPLLWSLASGSLPPGLALSNEGTVTGMPATAATETFVLRVGDRTGAEATLHASLSILPPPASPASPAVTPEEEFPKLQASKEQPFVNSLGMRFVPSGTEGVFFCIWLTRVSDFRAFVAATGYNAKSYVLSVEKGGKAEERPLKPLGDHWEQPGFIQVDDRPVCAVSWEDAKQFCGWLTQKEHGEGVLPRNLIYRLPQDAEWQRALCLEADPSGKPPLFPWGNGATPPGTRCNLAGAEIRNGEIPADWKLIARFRDNVPYTSPVYHFPPNPLGIHDLFGNLWQFCEDATTEDGSRRLLRGGSWLTSDMDELALSTRFNRLHTGRGVDAGFRCVIAPSTP